MQDKYLVGAQISNEPWLQAINSRPQQIKEWRFSFHRSRTSLAQNHWKRTYGGISPKPGEFQIPDKDADGAGTSQCRSQEKRVEQCNWLLSEGRGCALTPPDSTRSSLSCVLTTFDHVCYRICGDNQQHHGSTFQRLPRIPVVKPCSLNMQHTKGL
jgi:hypothetical protein